MTHPLIVDVDHPADFQVVEPAPKREVDKLERLANMANAEVMKALEELQVAIVECMAERSFKNTLKVENGARKLNKAIEQRTAYRVHSDTWREKHPEVADALDLDS